MVDPTVTRILGIDPGMTGTGFSILEKTAGGLTYKHSGAICPPRNIREGRLRLIYTELVKIVELYQPTAMAIEDTFFAKNAKSALQLGQAKGVAVLLGEMNHLPVFEYSPTAIKMAVVGFGVATKDQIKAMVPRILKLSKKIDSEHEADAIAVAICHAHSARLRNQRLAVIK
jgi:crossover junction endodeoxyribonuclease RuvC